MVQVLKQEILDNIKRDPILFGRVAEALGVAPTTLPRIIYDNDRKLTQIGVLKVLGKHLKKSQNDLLEEIRETNLA
jgi:hypothetical protein